jgi:hypothetical protein
MGGGIKYRHRNKTAWYEKLLMAADFDSLEWSKQQKMGMIFGTWNVGSLSMSVYLKTVLREPAKYKLHIVGVLEVTREKCDTELPDGYTYFCGNISNLVTGFILHTGIILVVDRVEFLSDRMPNIILRSRWCDIIFMNMHALSEMKAMIQTRLCIRYIPWVQYNVPVLLEISV